MLNYSYSSFLMHILIEEVLKYLFCPWKNSNIIFGLYIFIPKNFVLILFGCTLSVNRNVLYLDKSMSKFTIIFRL